jgi:hypothetical protein
VSAVLLEFVFRVEVSGAAEPVACKHSITNSSYYGTRYGTPAIDLLAGHDHRIGDLEVRGQEAARLPSSSEGHAGRLRYDYCTTRAVPTSYPLITRY